MTSAPGIKHTKLPWYEKPFGKGSKTITITADLENPDFDICNVLGWHNSYANTAFICLAVNNHDELVRQRDEASDALKEAEYRLSQIDPVHFLDSKSEVFNVIKKLRAAIARVSP